MTHTEIFNYFRDLVKNSPLLKDIYFTGGFVRDYILELPKITHDVDLVITKSGGTKELLDWLLSEYPDKFHGRCLLKNSKAESIILNIDSDNTVVIEAKDAESLGKDYMTRDFTINAIYMKVEDGELIEHVGNEISHCKDRLLKTIDYSSITFAASPVRMIRAVRFTKAPYNFKFATTLEPALYPTGGYLALPKEKIRQEFEKILTLPNPQDSVQAIRDLQKFGLLANICKPLTDCWGMDHKSKYHAMTVSDHILSVFEKVKASKTYGTDLRLLWAALLHDVGKARNFTWDGRNNHYPRHELYSAEMAESVLIRLKYSCSFISDVKVLIQNHMRLKQNYNPKTKGYSGSKKAIRKLISDLGNLFDLELELIDADNMSHKPEYNMPGQVEDIKRISQEIEIKEPKRNGVLISGDRIMSEFNLSPCPAVKEIKSVLQDISFEYPELDEEGLIQGYKNRYQGKIITLTDSFSNGFLKAYLITDDVSVEVRRSVFPSYLVQENKVLEVDALHYPRLYDRLIRDNKVKEELGDISKQLSRIELMEGFKSLKLKLKNHDLEITVSWDDGTETEIL